MCDVTPQLVAVDDALSVRISLLSMFTALHYAGPITSDGLTALAEIRQEVPDLILSELNLPGMSSVDLLSVVRRRFPLIRAIAMNNALSCWGVPFGVAADAFYPKDAHPGLLLQMMQDVTRPMRSALTLCTRPSAPVRIPARSSSGEPYATVTCSQCLGTFTGFRRQRWFASQGRLRLLSQLESPCDCLPSQPRVAAQAMAATEQFGGNSRDAAAITDR